MVFFSFKKNWQKDESGFEILAYILLQAMPISLLKGKNDCFSALHFWYYSEIKTL